MAENSKQFGGVREFSMGFLGNNLYKSYEIIKNLTLLPLYTLSQNYPLSIHRLNKYSSLPKLWVIERLVWRLQSKKVQAFVKKHAWVELFFLPPYSPEYNPIERFWHWLKQKVYGCKSFTTMKELLQQVRKLIWHFHEGRTVSKINFNYDAYANLL